MLLGVHCLLLALRRREWVEQGYTRTPSSQHNESPTKSLHSPRKVSAQRLDRQSTHDNYADSSSDDNSDAADLADVGSEEEYSDEEEYCMLVREVEGRRGGGCGRVEGVEGRKGAGGRGREEGGWREGKVGRRGVGKGRVEGGQWRRGGEREGRRRDGGGNR